MFWKIVTLHIVANSILVGVGKPMICKPHQEEDAALCYPKCKNAAGKTYSGVGPVCWESCPAKLDTDYGALCCLDKAHCTKKVIDLSKGVYVAVLKAVAAGEGKKHSYNVFMLNCSYSSCRLYLSINQSIVVQDKSLFHLGKY